MKIGLNYNTKNVIELILKLRTFGFNFRKLWQDDGAFSDPHTLSKVVGWIPTLAELKWSSRTFV